MTLAVFAEFAVFLFEFWGRKTMARKFSTVKNAETAKTLDSGGVNLLGRVRRAEGLVPPVKVGGSLTIESVPQKSFCLKRYGGCPRGRPLSYTHPQKTSPEEVLSTRFFAAPGARRFTRLAGCRIMSARP
jgi:hypothetical protein